jgi:photosystem II stability/assembly factor-like uncharacterized protein
MQIDRSRLQEVPVLSSRRFILIFASAASLALPVAGVLRAQAVFDPGQIALRWRNIGPFRGGRTKSAVGVPSQPGVFYIGMVGGGVWKTTDYGRVWMPIFDEQPSGSIGAIDVSISNPNVVYVGSGEGLQRPDLATGDGMYRSNDAGKTWTHLGLRDAQQIPRIAIDPTNPERLFVAALGHPYGPNSERGIFRSTDGGKSFQKVLFKDDYTGGADVVLAPNDPNTVYAALWSHQYGPWENGSFTGATSGLFKSTDGGATWKQLTNGIPTAAQGLGRIQIAVSPSDPKRLYVVATASTPALLRSDDSGESWHVVTTDNRIAGKADDEGAITVNPKNADIIYEANTVAWKSVDAGKTWIAHRGAPGGDDYQRYWIDPNNPNIMILVADQGAVITLNDGLTWSSWYNQPTAAFYHVAADNAFPYRLCSGQQDSGSGCVSSRGNDGTIGYREFHPVGVDEYGYAAPDPLNPDLVYGGASVTRYNRLTGQVQMVGPNAGGRGGRGGGVDTLFRHVRTAPVLFSTINPHKLFLGTNRVWQTTDAGDHWKSISPDLSRATWDVPKNVGHYAGTPATAVTQRGVVYTIAPSPVDSNTIWAGTDDGLIQVTRDNGKNWKNVTPPEIGPWAKVSIMDASHSDANVAYAAINTFHLDDLRPHIFRTRDGGKSWKEIVTGIDSGATINVVREDNKRKGLLFAGSETQVWFSLDDGDHWHSLRLNMPATSIRDLIVKDDDIAVGTHGRGFWILDDITALRQWSDSVAKSVALFKPAEATRVHYSMYTDSPVPPDEPYAENPPDGAVIDYYLARDVSTPVTLEIFTAAGLAVREFSSSDRAEPVKDVGNWPAYWFRPAQVLSTKAGLQRYVWDLHFRPLGGDCSLPISATPHNTKCEPEGLWVQPGQYTAKLTVDGKKYSQSFTVRMDPRVKTSAAALQLQYTLSLALYDAGRALPDDATLLRDLRRELADRKTKAPALSAQIDALDKKIVELAGPDAPAGRGGRGGQAAGGRGGDAPALDSYRSIAAELANAMNLLQASDGPPTSVVAGGARDKLRAFAALNARLKVVLGTDVPKINVALKAAGLQPVRTPPNPSDY